MLKSYFQEKFVECGCDEAGRGCLAGPVVAAAVILPKDYRNEFLNDSKQLSESKRNVLRTQIEKEAIDYSVSFFSHKQIDEVNILKASFLSMHDAVSRLKVKPELLLIDGNRFIDYPGIKHKCIIKGDAKFLSIAAASILAKTHRDDYMKKLHKEFPQYNWVKNKGYPTKEHRKAIQEYGVTPFHRKTFKLLPDQLTLSL